MTALAIISLLFGATLGVRFTVKILFPAMPIVLGGAVLTSLIMQSGPSATLLAIFFALTMLQIGYLIGAAIRPIAAPKHVRRPELIDPKPISQTLPQDAKPIMD
jgi:hypothetical protein